MSSGVHYDPCLATFVYSAAEAEPTDPSSDEQVPTEEDFNRALAEQNQWQTGYLAEWEKKLVGKKIVSQSSEGASGFSKDELPEKHRILEPPGIMTMDYYPDRLNVFLDDSGICTHLTLG